MKLERASLSSLVPNKKHPHYAITEAIKREAFFQENLAQFTLREAYMMLDIAYRPHQDIDVMNAVAQMLDSHIVP